jgi:hypothetical protein
MFTKKVFRVHAHDTTDTDYPCAPIMYYIAESEEQLRAEFEENNEGLVEIDWITEVGVEEVVNQLNLYID